MEIERELLDGKPLLSPEEFKTALQELTESSMNRDAGTLNFAGVPIPLDWAYENFLVVGEPGSGKSLIHRMLMNSLFNGDVKNRFRAIINDQKGDLIPYLASLGLLIRDNSLKLLNLMDPRSVQWDIAADITNPIDVHELVDELFTLENQGNDPYWCNKAKEITRGVLRSLIRRYTCNWTFAQFIGFIDLGFEELLDVLEWTAENRGVVTRLRRLNASTPKTVDTILDVIASHLEQYKTIATLAEMSRRGKVSAKEFFAENYSLIMRVPADATRTHAMYNRLFFKQLAKAFLKQTPQKQKDGTYSHTFMLLDEFAAMGKIEELPALLEEGRDRGIVVSIAFHDIDQIKNIYGEVTLSLLSRFRHMAILNTNHRATQEWAADVFGEVTEVVTIAGKSNQVSQQAIGERRFSSLRTLSETANFQGTIHPHPLISPSSFAVQSPTVTGTINGHFRISGLNVFKSLPMAWILGNIPAPSDQIQATRLHDLSTVQLYDGTEFYRAAIPQTTTMH